MTSGRRAGKLIFDSHSPGMGLSESRIDNIMYAGILMISVRIGISDNVCKNRVGLPPDEYDKIKEHSAIGADILRDIDFLRMLPE